MPDIYRAQVVMQDSSGLPEDVYVNNLYFRNDFVGGSQADVANAIASVLDAAYGQANGTSPNPLSVFLSANISSVLYKVYDLGQATPRYPVVEPIEASWTGSPGARIVQEAAICLSFKGGPGPSERGRIYLGPLNDAAASQAGNYIRPTTGFIDAALEAAVNIINTSENVTWVVASPTTGGTTVITEAWVDNAMDTVRSRGAASTTRFRADAGGIIP